MTKTSTHGQLFQIFSFQTLGVSQQCVLKTKNYPKFYQELVQTWAGVSEKEPSNAFEVCIECLWNNRLITSNGESLYNRHFIAKGIIRVQDIVDQNGLLLLWSGAQEKYSLNNSLILNWQGLIKNIPKNWKSMLSNDHIELLAAEGKQNECYRWNCISDNPKQHSKTANSAKVFE